MSDPCFEDLHNVCDCEFRRLHQRGVGTACQHAEAFDEQNECKLWESQVLNVETPNGLFNCVFL